MILHLYPMLALISWLCLHQGAVEEQVVVVVVLVLVVMGLAIKLHWEQLICMLPVQSQPSLYTKVPKDKAVVVDCQAAMCDSCASDGIAV